MNKVVTRILLAGIALGGFAACNAKAEASPASDMADAETVVCQILTHQNSNAEMDSLARKLLAGGYNITAISAGLRMLVIDGCPSLMPVYNEWIDAPWTPETASTTGTMA